MKRVGPRRRFFVVPALVLAFSFIVAVPASAANIVLAAEPFTGASTASGVWLYGGTNFTPCLTAGTVSTAGSIPVCGTGEAVGSGALRFADNNGSEATYVVLNTPIATSTGLQVEFDMSQYGGGGTPGDGMTFMLLDGSITPSASGASGAALGYASYGSTPGIQGGYVGIAFDVYGAFSNTGTGTGGWPIGGSNRITVRGSEASGYNFITTHTASGPLSNGGTFTRSDATRHVVVSISSQNVMSVTVDYGSGPVTEISGLDLTTVNGAGTLPATLKLGFTGGTGGSHDIEEIQNFQLLTLAPDLGVTVVPGTINSSTLDGSVGLVVKDDPAAGSTNGVVTVTSTLPTGVTPVSATGAGWSCTIAAQLVTCTRPGTGAGRLNAGASYPLITLGLTVTSLGTLPATIAASVSVLDDSNATNDVGSGALTLLELLSATNGLIDWWLLYPAGLLIAAGVTLIGIARALRPDLRRSSTGARY